MVEVPDPDPYSDSELKDLVGEYPRLYCAYCMPPKALRPGESVRCLDRETPCWKPADHICDD